MRWKVIYEGQFFDYDESPSYSIDQLYKDVAAKTGQPEAQFYLVYQGTDQTLQRGGTMASNGIPSGALIQAVRQNTGGC